MLEFTAKGQPMPMPRQTQKSKYNPSLGVINYRGYADSLRLAAHGHLYKKLPGNWLALSCEFVFEFPPGYRKGVRALAAGTPHRQRPDLSNLIKGVEDALLAQDSGLAFYAEPVLKRWVRHGENAHTLVRLYAEEDFREFTRPRLPARG